MRGKSKFINQMVNRINLFLFLFYKYFYAKTNPESQYNLKCQLWAARPKYKYIPGAASPKYKYVPRVASPKYKYVPRTATPKYK